MRRTVRIALLQLAAFGLEEARESLSHTLARIDEAAAFEPDLVVLPEVTYPAYFLGSPQAYPCPDAPSPEEALAALSGVAVRHSLHLAAGLALDSADRGLTNAAVLIGPDGQLIGRYDKSFLWDFDRHWYAPGGRYPVFETELGRLGLLICADGRLPEIPRCLAVGGAQILVDLTAWVSWGRRVEELTNPQREYMMSVRALENGVWVVAASKVGVEADSIVYCGRSCVIDPHGRVLVGGAPDGEEMVVHDIVVSEGTSPPVERRPELYASLVTPTAELPATGLLNDPTPVHRQSHRVATVSLSPCRSQGDLMARVQHFVHTLRTQDAEAIVFSEPSVRGRLPRARPSVMKAVAALSREEGGLLALALAEETDEGTYKTGYLWADGRLLLAHRQTHLLPAERDAGIARGDRPCPVVETAAGRAALVLGAEGLVPEAVRCLMLEGAELLLWPSGDLGLDLLPLVRCRADENRVYVAAASPTVPESGALIVSPTGQVVASSLGGREMAVSAQMNHALARWKDMAPGTNVILNRQPETYGALVRPTRRPGGGSHPI